MTTGSRKKANLLLEVYEAIARATPAAVARTFVAIRTAGKSIDNPVVVGMANQEWPTVVRPWTYALAPFTLIALLDFVRSRISPANRASESIGNVLLTWEAAGTLAIMLGLALPLHFVLRGARSPGSVRGAVDGISKIVQALLYFLGQFFWMLTILFACGWLDSLLWSDQRWIMILVGVVLAVFVLWPLLWLNLPAMLAELYGRGRDGTRFALINIYLGVIILWILLTEQVLPLLGI